MTHQPDWLKVALALRDRAKEETAEAMRLEKSPYDTARKLGLCHETAALIFQGLAIAIERGTLKD